MKGCKEVTKSYLPTNELRGIGVAKLLADWSKISGSASQPIYGSLASARNYYLNSHTDGHFFYSLKTRASAYGLRQDILDRNSMDAKVCNYFMFAEQGITVALRPGDMLLFNPTYQHCLSSCTSLYENKDVFCLSLYLKTAIVGKNDNNIPLP
jgi:hypothetical protein